jgi:acid stress-induced BolA-like protein IbaG/YrbA
MMETRQIKSIPAYGLQVEEILATDDGHLHVIDWISDEPRGVTRVLVEVDGDIYERRYGVGDPEETVEVVAS